MASIYRVRLPKYHENVRDISAKNDDFNGNIVALIFPLHVLCWRLPIHKPIYLDIFILVSFCAPLFLSFMLMLEPLNSLDTDS